MVARFNLAWHAVYNFVGGQSAETEYRTFLQRRPVRELKQFSDCENTTSDLWDAAEEATMAAGDSEAGDKPSCKRYCIADTATKCHLPYEITQCYLPPDTSELTPP